MFETMPKTTAVLGSVHNLVHVLAYGFSAWNTWFLGFHNRAAKKLDEAFSVARSSDSKSGEELVHSSATFFFSLVRERERAREHAEALVILSTELGNPPRRAVGELYLVGSIQLHSTDRRASHERSARWPISELLVG